MKKEYKAPLVTVLNADKETPILCHSDFAADSKKSGRGFVDDEEEVPATEPKKFWDDED
ncbi:MAG: hypothetical protein IK124_08520 [Prevotella sp.]|nr:hypothetical protein [Prevotella sp.]